jgi:hypothetical protein
MNPNKKFELILEHLSINKKEGKQW